MKLYNPLDSELDISGYIIEDNKKSWTVPDGTVIHPGNSLLIARNSEGFYNMTGCYPDLDSLTLSLNNDGDILRIKSGTQELDMVSWEGFEPGWDISASTGKSIRRMGQDTDSPPDWLSEQEPEHC